MNITAFSSASVRSLIGTSTSTAASTVSSTESSQSGAVSARSSTARSAASAPPGIAELSNAVGKLQDLAESDPEAFTAAATEIAKSLREAADEAGGTGPLSDLADRFEAAAKSGDASQLAPPRPPEGGRGPHGPPPGGAPPGGGHGGPPPGGASEAQRAADAYKANKASRERVLQPFERLDRSRSRDRGGIGLGLAITRRIVERHGGRIVIATAPLGGAELRVWLPSHGAAAA